MCNSQVIVKAKEDVLWIPVNLALYVEQNNLFGEFELYITLKLYCSGKIHAASKLNLLKQIGLDVKIRTTFNKRLEKLKQLNWIGHNESSGYYFIRSFDSACLALKIKTKHWVKFCTTHFNQMRVFIFAAIICDRINRMQRAKQSAFRKKRSGIRLVPLYLDNGTKQQLDSPSFLEYNGLPGSVMKRITGKSSSRCMELRTEAHKAGFLKSKQKKQLVDTYPITPFMKEILRAKHEGKSGRFTVKVFRAPDMLKLKIFEQLPNEIIPRLEFKVR